MADSEEDEDATLFHGVVLPSMNASSSSAPFLDDDDDDDDAPAPGPAAAVEESEEDTGLVNAEAAFELDTAPGALDLDPFRVAPPVEQPPRAETKPGAPAKPTAAANVNQKKVFVGGLPYDMDDAALVKFFMRYGKVQEATVVKDEGGKPRGFGFVTFVHMKGAQYCIGQIGDEGKLDIGGRSCAVRFSQDRGSSVAHYKMPARGQYNPNPAKEKVQERAPGGVGGRPSGGGAGASGAKRVAEDEEGEVRQRKARKKKEELVTISRRQDAEPLWDKAITMRELFPKEFWRV